ncbi:hypothetical protein [Nocardioides pantholopis]|uniref:hypothetical protein n=1 Tax=Nocardioides pantholopis TaxID=2483798 RepID=UPI0013DE256C|nr:hypothetical protein [Nocardioides pantholopis]
MIAAYFAPPRVDLVIALALLLCGSGLTFVIAVLIIVHAALRPSPGQGAVRPDQGAPTG